MSFELTIDPDAVLDVAYDWTAWLAEDETISSYVLTPTDGISVDTDSKTDSIVTAWVSGATGRVQRVTCHIVTSQGREDDRTTKFNVRDR